MRLSAALVDGTGRVQNPPQIRHLPSEAPYSNGADMITRVGLNLPFRGMPAGSTPTVAVTMSQPLGHVLRHITIPGLRLSDWQVKAAP